MNTQHSVVHCYLLQIKLPLNFREVTGVIKDGLGQLVLYVGQPGAKAVHVFIQLLYSHQSFSELLHSVDRKKIMCTFRNKACLSTEACLFTWLQ